MFISVWGGSWYLCSPADYLLCAAHHRDLALLPVPGGPGGPGNTPILGFRLLLMDLFRNMSGRLYLDWVASYLAGQGDPVFSSSSPVWIFTRRLIWESETLMFLHKRWSSKVSGRHVVIPVLFTDPDKRQCDHICECHHVLQSKGPDKCSGKCWRL